MTDSSMSQTVGAHTAQIEILLQQQSEMKADFDELRKDVHAIRNAVDSYVATINGSWKVLVIIVAMAVAVVKMLAWAVEQFRGKLP